MLGCTPVTTRLIRSTTEENSKLRVYWVWACCWNNWSSAAAVKACSTVARAMTLRGLSARNGVKICSSSMACPPGRPALYVLGFQHLTTHQADAKGLRQTTLEGLPPTPQVLSPAHRAVDHTVYRLLPAGPVFR